MTKFEIVEQQWLEAARKHDDIKFQKKQVGAQAQAKQAELSAMSKWNQNRASAMADLRDLNITLAKLGSDLLASSRMLQICDQRMYLAKHGRDAITGEKKSTPETTAAPAAQRQEARAVLELNNAQVAHLQLLATRVRSAEFKLSARVKAALDFIAIITPLLVTKASSP